MRLPGNGRPTSADLDLAESHRLHRRNRQQLERGGRRGRWWREEGGHRFILHGPDQRHHPSKPCFIKNDDSERQQKSRRCLYFALCKVCGKQIVSGMVEALHPQCNLVTTHREIIDAPPTVLIYSPPFLTLSPIRTHQWLSVDVTAPPASLWKKC